jgi:hypothetical protein
MRDDQKRALLADGGKGEAVAWMTDDGRVATDETKTMAMHGSTAKSFHIPLYAAPQVECAPREAQPVAQWLRDLRRAHEYLDKGKPFFTGKDCAELADLIESIAAPTPERAQESAGVRLTPEQSGAIQIAISILTPEYLLTANRLRSIVATIDAELAKKEGA